MQEHSERGRSDSPSAQNSQPRRSVIEEPVDEGAERPHLLKRGSGRIESKGCAAVNAEMILWKKAPAAMRADRRRLIVVC